MFETVMTTLQVIWGVLILIVIAFPTNLCFRADGEVK
jgi:hypothetical protein